MKIDEALNQAIAHQRAGRLAQAEHLYRAILAVQPQHPDAAHNLGVLAVTVGKPEGALPLFAIAREANPRVAQYWLSTAKALVAGGRGRDAQALLEEARVAGLEESGLQALTGVLAQQPERAQGLQPAIAHREAGRYDAACAWLDGYLKTAEQDSDALALRVQCLLLANRVEEAEKSLAMAEATAPSAPVVQRARARVLLHSGEVEAAAQAAEVAFHGEPENPEGWLVLASALRLRQDNERALALVERCLTARPDYAEAFANRALLRLSMGNPEAGRNDIDRALRLKPHLVQLWPLAANLRYQQGDRAGAIAALHHAVEREPRVLAHRVNLGEYLRQDGQIESALDVLNQAVAMDAGHAGAWTNLGAALQDAGRRDEAKAAYRRALAITPELAEVASNLGVMAADEGDWEQALAAFDQALAANPAFGPALTHRAAALRALGRDEDALFTLVRALEIAPSAEAKRLFVECVKGKALSTRGEALRPLLMQALVEPWGNPDQLTRASLSIVQGHPDVRDLLLLVADAWPQRLPAQALFDHAGFSALASDPLFAVLLKNVRLPDMAMERLLIQLRHGLLQRVIVDEDALLPGYQPFFAGLAQHCFINGYLYPQTEDEKAVAAQLYEGLRRALAANDAVRVPTLVTMACYVSLDALPSAEQLLAQPWPSAIRAVLTQQIAEPAAERRLREGIPALTTIADAVSRRVQSQYEEHPYPRWHHLAPEQPARSLDAFIQQYFPLARYVPLGACDPLEILIAGCGTGRHSASTAQRFPHAHILAIDLSRASLAYAKRKSEELRLNGLEYAQADLLELAAQGRRFHLIEASGVLHHLADPWTGWRELLALLRPHGVMKLGLYSELARQGIVRARELIAEKGYLPTPDDIRRCRQELFDSNTDARFGLAVQSTDFFSLQTCRDLIFHTQETRLRLPAIQAFLKQHSLTFLGFAVDGKIGRDYLQRFPGDPAGTDLDNWRVFEEERPETFVGMYQFWVQQTDTLTALAASSKPDATANNDSPAVKALLRAGIAHHRAGATDAAEVAFQQVLRVEPGCADALHLLGVLAYERGEHVQADHLMRQAIAAEPSVAAYYSSHGAVLRALGRPKDALDAYDAALQRAPDYAEAHNNRGYILQDEGRHQEALQAYDAALRCKPDYATALSNRGSVLLNLSRLEEALAAFDAALALEPGALSALTYKANALKRMGRLGDALAVLSALMEVEPQEASHRYRFHLSLPVIAESAADMQGWRNRYRQGLEALLAQPGKLNQVADVVHDGFYLAYHHDNNRDLMEAVADLYRRSALAIHFQADHLATWSYGAKRRIRLGLCSKFFVEHTIGKLYQGFIRQLDRDRFEVVLLRPPHSRVDEFSELLDQSADQVIRLPDRLDHAHAIIARAGLDVLFYPDIGMSVATYFLAFARLAPVQVVSWGHPHTTGIKELDYFVSAVGIEPAGADAHYSERLVTLTRLPCYYEPMMAPTTIPGRASLGLPASGTLYGCPQTLFKFHPDFDAILAEILHGDPHGYLVVIEGAVQHWVTLLRQRWAKTAPILNERTLFLPRQPLGRFMALMAHFDVLLDPIYFGSGNTLYEAMVYGTPIVTWPGPFMRGRVVAGAYQQMGVADAPIAERLQDYAPLALELGRDPVRRKQLREDCMKAAGEDLLADKRAVQELEAFLVAAVEAAGRGERLPVGWQAEMA